MKPTTFKRSIISIQLVILLVISFQSVAMLGNGDIFAYDELHSFSYQLEDQDVAVITFHLSNTSFFGLEIQITEGGSFSSDLNILYQSMDGTNTSEFILQNQGNKCITITNQDEIGSHSFTITNMGRFMGGDQLTIQATAIISNNQTFIEDLLTCPAFSARVVNDTFLPRLIYIGFIAIIIILVFIYINRN